MKETRGRFFFDECISSQIALALRHVVGSGIVIAILGEGDSDHGVAKGTKDSVWFPQVAKLDYIAVTVDRKQTTRPEEVAARASCGLRTIWMPQELSSKSCIDQAATVFRIWPKVEQESRGLRAGEGVIFRPDGRTTRWPVK